VRELEVHDVPGERRHATSAAGRAQAARLAGQGDEVIVSARSAAKARKAVGEHPAAQEALERLIDERGYAARFTGHAGKRGTLFHHERVQRRGARVVRTMDPSRR
jgi:NAD(P)-dependent dehydrogenase (short-subunit alcohol dehydrogenase family)